MKGDAVTGNEVLDRMVSQAGNGRSPAEPPSRPRNRKALRTLALVVLLVIAGVLAWANWATVSSIFHGGNGSDRIIGLSGRIEGDDSAVASKTSGRILEVRVREGDSVNAGQILAVLEKGGYTRLALLGAVSERQGKEAVANADQQAAAAAAAKRRIEATKGALTTAKANVA